MFTPANRIEEVSEYFFSKKLKEIERLRQTGKDIINLGIGNPDMPPSSATIEILCQEAQKPTVHGYQSYVGIPELREAFAQWYLKWFGVALDPTSEIQPLIGSKEGILHITLAFVNSGEGVLIPNPGYPTYTSASKICGANVVPYSLDTKSGWQPDFEALEHMDLSNIKLMWVNYPNMPTGANGNKVLFERLVAFGKKHNIVICNDNPYSFILNNEKNSILAVDGAKEVCIELNSMSKSHNMAGWRMAMLASNAQFVEWVLRVKSNVDSGMFRPMMSAAITALKNSYEWHKEINQIYAKRKIIAKQIMTRINSVYDDNQVGMFLWGKIADSEKDALTLVDNILYERGIFITPGTIFGSQGERYIRISLCSSEDKLREALRRLTV